MRTLTVPLLSLWLCIPTIAQDQIADSTGLPGDHFNLAGALELFKQAKDLESFEKSLNTEDQKVNNLDLDGNGEVDYVRVVAMAEGDAHAITMQVALGKEEVQDVAVVQLEKNGEQSAMLQILGAEELYGSNVIVEPFEEEDGAPGRSGPSSPEEMPRFRVWVNVWSWPCVSYIYSPYYVGWDSPWYWGFYPPWYRPWRPWGWNAWYGWHRPYQVWYHHVDVCRVQRANALYQPRASHSPRIRTNTASLRSNRAGIRNNTAPGKQPTMDERNRQSRDPAMNTRDGQRRDPALNERAPQRRDPGVDQRDRAPRDSRVNERNRSGRQPAVKEPRRVQPRQEHAPGRAHPTPSRPSRSPGRAPSQPRRR